MPSSETPSHVALPAELWALIFEFATYAPYAVEHFQAESIDSMKLRDRCKSALKDSTRRSLPLVCKTWYELSIEFLYQSINIDLSKLAAATSLAYLLESRNPANRPNVRNNRKPRELGAYTRRIDVSFSVQGRGSVKKGSSGWSLLADIIEYLPHLSIVVFHESCQLHSSQKGDFALAFESIYTRPALEVLDWSSCQITLSSYQLRKMLLNTNLRHLYCSSLTLPGNAETLLSSNTLTTLSFHSSVPDEAMSSKQVSLPALRHLISSGQKRPGRLWHSLLRVCGPHLISVSFAPPSIRLEGAFQDDVNLVARMCPNLRRLTLTIDTGYGVPEELDIPPVRALGIRFAAEEVSEPSLRFLGHVLTGACQRTPTLERIRFSVDPKGQRGKEFTEFMESFLNLPLMNVWEGD